MMEFINTRWCYPGDIPGELTGLHLAAESFLCPIMVFCELTNSKSGEGRSTRAGYHFAQGRIGLYNSPDFLGEFSGTRGIGRNRGPSDESGIVANIPEVMRISRNEIQVDENPTTLRDEIMMPVDDGGPRTADEEHAFRDLVFGVDDQNHLVKYSNPKLMGLLFPSLYVNDEVGSAATVENDGSNDDSGEPFRDNDGDEDLVNEERGYRYSQATTVAIPSSIRTGIKYKQQLYLRFSAIFDKFGTPELFGTYSCDANNDGQQNLAREFHGDGAATHTDPVLFVKHWTLQWQKFFSSQINGYNMDLLRFGRVNMDLQYNFGTSVKRYMCKYITKQAAIHKATIAQDRNGGLKNSHVLSDAYVQNFHYRSVSITEAIMDLCSFEMSGASHQVVYLDTSLPEKRNYMLKRAKDIGRLAGDDEEIFMDDKWKKYRQRPMNIAGRDDDIEGMCYKEYYEKFHYVTIQSVKRMYVDQQGRKVCRRLDDKLAVIRTRTINVTNSEDAFMQLLMLHWPTRTEVTEWLSPHTQYRSYQELASEKLGRDRIAKLARGLLVVLDFGISPQLSVAAEVEEVSHILTEDQEKVYNHIRETLGSEDKLCQLLVTGAAGTGKSTLLRKVGEYAAKNRFEVVHLAPSGVAAVNIRGQTIHSWFRMARMSKGSYFTGNSYVVRGQLIEIASKGRKPLFLVDEASMISGTLLSSMGATLSAARYGDGNPFGGVHIIYFGDFGQLGPINRWQKRIDWFWRSALYRKLERHDLITACRQETDVEFKSFLDDIRRGKIEPERAGIVLEILENGNNGGIPEDAIRLMTHRKQGDEFNSICLGRLEGAVWTSKAEDNGGVIQDRDLSDSIAAETGLVSDLHLKVGAMVMCTSNIIRLTKAAEAGRVLGDVIEEIAEENGSSKVDMESLVRRLMEELGIVDFNEFERSND
ncbi:hypothetical protein KVV02_004907 [Mortierella alpina]|uniref:ATP-dependent DNA helicase n=1 Tax=Mortierella alpina TaxID=64518 RepID=A0A9P7ZXB6_MORAP|nr:hypothetical protein KVV02_004907 [Mortierella alpina]